MAKTIGQERLRLGLTQQHVNQWSESEVQAAQGLLHAIGMVGLPPEKRRGLGRLRGDRPGSVLSVARVVVRETSQDPREPGRVLATVDTDVDGEGRLELTVDGHRSVWVRPYEGARLLDPKATHVPAPRFNEFWLDKVEALTARLRNVGDLILQVVPFDTDIPASAATASAGPPAHG